MWLAVDCGNSRVKWAAVQNGRAAAVRTAAIAPLRSSSALSELRRTAARASEAWVSHVGAGLSREELRETLCACKKIRFVRSVAAGGGVVNRYRPPSSLGVDRWLALVAARALRRDVIVVGAGTAATIDALRGDGVFVGGAALPGIRLSRETLARRTGLSSFARGEKMILPPQNTRAAAAAGAVSAIVGAALFLRRRLLPGARFVIGGGDAELLLPWLPKTAAHIPHLPICGLVRLRGMRS